MELHHMAPRCRSQVNVFLRLRWGDADNSVLKWVTPRFLSHQRFVKKDVEEVLHYSLANRYIYWMMLLHHFIQHLPCEWSFDWKGPLAHPQQLPTRTQALFGPSSLDDLCFVPLLSPICFTLFTLAYLFSLIDNGRDGILISIVVFFPPTFAHFPACPVHFGNLATLALRQALNFSFSWQESALLLSFWVTK